MIKSLLETKQRVYGMILIPFVLTLWLSVAATYDEPEQTSQLYLINAIVVSVVIGLLSLLLRNERTVVVFETVSISLLVVYLLAWDVYDFFNKITVCNDFFVSSVPLIILTSIMICFVLPEKIAMTVVLVFFSAHCGLGWATQLQIDKELRQPEWILDTLQTFSAVLVVTLVTTYNRMYLYSQTMASTDVLTGLLNRRGMSSYIERHEQCILMLIDIDNFKHINDTLGHDAGDKVLIHVARILDRLIRKEGRAARWGGEEFIVMLPKTQLDEGKKMAEFIRETIEIRTKNRTPVTLSIGVAEKHMDDDINSIISQADQRMYHAKNNGKNQVCSHDE